MNGIHFFFTGRSKPLCDLLLLAYKATPSGYCIYTVYHLYYNIVYAGMAVFDPVRGLHKPMRDALAF